MNYDIPTPERQVAMVLDLNKCLGCQTCSVACKKLWNTDAGTDYTYWNNVETMPGKGYPANWQQTGGRNNDGTTKQGTIPDIDTEYGRAWQFNHKEVLATDAKDKQKQWLKPVGKAPEWGPNWDEDHGEGQYPQDNYYFYLPRLCNHCDKPACLEACPRRAIEKNPENGIVTVNQDRCHGYRFCVEACPYKKVYFDTQRQVAAKCIFCMPRIEEGVAPACARQCPGRLRFVGYLNDTDSIVNKLVNKWKVALPLRADFGTGPNVYYVPPLAPSKLDAQGNPTEESRIPTEYLISLFGPSVEKALDTIKTEREKRKRGETSELMDLLIAYDWNKNFKLDRKA